MLVKFNGTTVVEYPYYREMLEKDHPNTSFPMNLVGVDLSDFGVASVWTTVPPVVDYTKQVVEVYPTLKDGVWKQTWSIVNAPEDLKAEWLTNAWERLRTERDKLLSSSDWTQVADAPVDKTAWATYRQVLRDLPSNTTDPFDPVWPTKPV